MEFSERTLAEKKLYSLEPKKGLKKYGYLRYCMMRDRVFQEEIYCKNDLTFLQFLNDMNNLYRHSKFFSQEEYAAILGEVERTMDERLSNFYKKFLETNNLDSRTRKFFESLIKNKSLPKDEE